MRTASPSTTAFSLRPGSPYQSFDGMLRGIQFARERNWPFVGT